jgi:hypothetical protein
MNEKRCYLKIKYNSIKLYSAIASMSIISLLIQRTRLRMHDRHLGKVDSVVRQRCIGYFGEKYPSISVSIHLPVQVTSENSRLFILTLIYVLALWYVCPPRTSVTKSVCERIRRAFTDCLWSYRIVSEFCNA